MSTEQLDALVRDIEVAADYLPGDLGEALRECDVAILQGIEENFAGSQTARGGGWPARKDPKPQHPLLILTGELQAYATGGSGDAEITENELTRRLPGGSSGTSLAGVRRHEFGDEVILGQSGILARPYFGISEATADRCADIIADVIAEQFN